MGNPYQRQIKQFKRAYMYGIPENCSVDPFLIILLNVGLKKTNETNVSKNKPCISFFFFQCANKLT